MRAGLLDRAEKLFSDLTRDGRYSEHAVRSLLSIYQQEKDWKHAIVQARKLEQVADRDSSPLIAQFHCELASEAWDADEPDNAYGHLDIAVATHRECTRAYLLRAEFDSALGRWEDAAENYRAACELDPDIVVLIDDALARCYSELGREDELLDWLRRLGARGSTSAPVLAFASIQARRDPERASAFLLEQLQRRPTARGLHQLLELKQDHDDPADPIDRDLLRDLMRRLLEDQPRFRCSQCGFSGQTWHWQCPSCREWETTRPVVGVLGE